MILVGNGASAADSDLGEVIDSFKTIVRFSWFWIEGFEEKVGTRTDIWSTTIYCKKRLAENSFSRVIAHSWQWDPSKCKTFRLLRDAFPEVEKTKRETIREMSDFIDLEKTYAFSTGAIMAWIFLKDRDSITLTGFDWAKGILADRHHYGDKQTRGGIHQPDLEFQFFQKLKQQKKIRFL